MKEFNVDEALKLANKDLTPYTDYKIRDLRRALRLACAEIKSLRAENGMAEVTGSQAAYEGVLMQTDSLTKNDWTLDDFKKWLDLKIYRCKQYVKTGGYES